MANNIAITISVNAQDVDAARKKFAMLREQGEKLRGLGMAISAGITLPILAGGVALVKFGADAKKTVDEASAAMKEANLSGDPKKIAEAAAANRAISIATRESANAYAELDRAMQPVNAAVQKFQAEALTALVPLLKEATPMLATLAKNATDLVRGFVALPEPAKNVIMAVGGLAIALGPAVTLLGQAKWMMGTIGLMAPGLAAGITAIVGPVAALALAVLALVEVFKMDEFKKGMAVLRGQATLAFTGDKTKAAISAQNAYQELGGGAPGSTDTGAMVRGTLGSGVPQKSTGNGVTVNYIDQSMVSTASPEKARQAAQIIGPLVQQAQQTQTGRR